MRKKCDHIVGRLLDNRGGWCFDRGLLYASTRSDLTLYGVYWWKFCPLCGVSTARAIKRIYRDSPFSKALSKTLRAGTPFMGCLKRGKFPQNLGLTKRTVK